MPICTICGTMMHEDDVIDHVCDAEDIPVKGSPRKLKGISGYSGSKGDKGDKGDPGEKGNKGDGGDSGYSGYSGAV